MVSIFRTTYATSVDILYHLEAPNILPKIEIRLDLNNIASLRFENLISHLDLYICSKCGQISYKGRTENGKLHRFNFCDKDCSRTYAAS